MDITLEKYRTKEPPKEHEEAVRMLLESIAINNNNNNIQEPSATRSLARKTSNRRTMGDNYDRGSLKTSSSSTGSSSGTTNKMKATNINRSYLPNEDAISTTTSSSMVSKSTSANEIDHDDFLAQRNPSYKDPIPSRTIAVQCDLKLSSVKRDNSNLFDASMQASSISSTKYGFYNFSQETLEQRRKLQLQQQQQEQEEQEAIDNEKSHTKNYTNRISANQIEAPTSMSELSTSSSSLFGSSKAYPNSSKSKIIHNSTQQTTNINKLNSKFSSSAYKLDNNNSENNINNYSMNRLSTRRGPQAVDVDLRKNGAKVERFYNNKNDSLPPRPMTALSYVSSSRLHESGANNNPNGRNGGYNYDDYSSCENETQSINMPRPIKSHQRAISQQVLSSSQAMARNTQKPFSSTPTPVASNGRLFKQQHSTANGYSEQQHPTASDDGSACNNWSDCDLTDNQKEHFDDYKVPCSEEMLLVKRVHPMLPLNQQHQRPIQNEGIQNKLQQNCLENNNFDEISLNRTLTRSSSAGMAPLQKQNVVDNRIPPSVATFNNREIYLQQQQQQKQQHQQINPDKKFNSIQRNRDQELDENSNSYPAKTTNDFNSPIHYSSTKQKWNEYDLNDSNDYSYDQQQPLGDYRRFDVRSRSMYNKNHPAGLRSLSRNGLTKENKQLRGFSGDEQFNNIEMINGQSKMSAPYKPSNGVMNNNNKAQTMTENGICYSQTLQTRPRKPREADHYPIDHSMARVTNRKLDRHYDINQEPADVTRSTSMRQINQPDQFTDYYQHQHQQNNNNPDSYVYKTNNITNENTRRRIDCEGCDYDNNFSDSPSTKTWSNPNKTTLLTSSSSTSTNRKLPTSDSYSGPYVHGGENRKSSRSYSMRNVNNIAADNYGDDATLTRQQQQQATSRKNGTMYNYNYNQYDYNDDGDESTSNSSNSMEQAQRFVRSPPLDYDSQHRLNESGLPEVNSMSEAEAAASITTTTHPVPIVLNQKQHNRRPSTSASYIGTPRSFDSNANLSSYTNGSNTMGRMPQITGRAMSQQSLSRPTMPSTNGRRVKRGNGGSGSEVGGSSMSLVSRLHGRYENAHTRTPVIMYIPQVNPKQKTGSSSSLIAQKSTLPSQFSNSLLRKSAKSSSKFKSSSSSEKLKRSGSSHNGSESESSSMLRTLVKPRGSRTIYSSRRGQHNRNNYMSNNNNNSYDVYDVEDMDGVGQLVTEMEGYKFKRRYSVPKDAKINWFAKLKQRVSSSGGK